MNLRILSPILAPCLLACEVVGPGDAKLEPLTNKIVFSAVENPSQVHRPLAMNPDGSGLFELPVRQAGSVFAAGLSSDGLTLAYLALDDLWVVGIDGKRVRNLTAEVGEVRDATWSHNGMRIAFTALRATDFEVYVVNANGTGLHPLSGHAVHDSRPSWSPDDSQIIFESDRDPNARLYIMNSDGSDQRPLAAAGPTAMFPSWSPDGQQIAFVTEDIGSLKLNVVNVDGSGFRPLPTPGYAIWRVDWSPDGSQLVLSCLGAKLSLCMIDADGTDFRELTANSGTQEIDPTW
jgi:TolB protein